MDNLRQKDYLGTDHFTIAKALGIIAERPGITLRDWIEGCAEKYHFPKSEILDAITGSYRLGFINQDGKEFYLKYQ